MRLWRLCLSLCFLHARTFALAYTLFLALAGKRDALIRWRRTLLLASRKSIDQCARARCAWFESAYLAAALCALLQNNRPQAGRRKTLAELTIIGVS